MDNKRSYKKLATFFWTTITFLPFIFALVLFVGMVFKSLVFEATDYVAFDSFISNFAAQYNSITDFFDSFTFAKIYDMFYLLFGASGLIPIQDYMIDFSSVLGYMVTIQFIHLIFDVIVWLPNLFHKWLNKERF